MVCFATADAGLLYTAAPYDHVALLNDPDDDWGSSIRAEGPRRVLIQYKHGDSLF